MSTDAT